MDYHRNNLSDFLQTNGRMVLQKVDNNYSLRYFTENEIWHITNGYSTMLGNGAFGKVYKGVLGDHSAVAVKRYNDGTKKEDFAKEVIVHSQINHKNVVRLLGCCTEKNALMIVMEFISGGNLDSILHCRSINDVCIPFPLDKRLDIAINVAEALWCMHSMYSPVLHGDIKPANIMLDENLTPKVLDFGIARLLCAREAQHTENIIGSIGYVDPAYCESGILTPKSDVYSFGVVLLEIITRKKAVDIITLAQRFSEAHAEGKDVLHMFDKEINGIKNLKFLGDLGHLASNCLMRDVKMRPEMIEVATSLRMIKKDMQGQQGYLGEQHTSVPKNSIKPKNLWSEAYQFGTLNIFEKEEMKNMTRNYGMTFKKELREHLYNGVHGKGHPIIVKQLRTRSEQERDMFMKTMGALSQKNHKNIANVVGFHLGEFISECVYESCCDLSQSDNGLISFSNRNLYESICSMEKLPLHVRLSIAVQCAEGLVHIHSLAAKYPDSHNGGSNLLGNFRSANIFLDKNFVPKVFNTNLSTFLGLSAVQQSNDFAFHIGDHESEKYYLDPRDVSGQLFNPKSDVYSFGVVLLELITWKTVRYISDGRAYMLTTDFLDTYAADRDAINIFGKVYDEAGPCFIHEAIAIARKCLQLDFQKRPEMSSVLLTLRTIAAAQSIRSIIAGPPPAWKTPCDGGVVGGKNEARHLTAPTPVDDTAKTLPSGIANISLQELESLTSNFSQRVLIGEGSYGRVFSGTLKNGRKCAVKKIVRGAGIRVQDPTISVMCQHDNVVEVLAYFVGESTRVLAYEYAPKGSLSDNLRRGRQPPLSWLQRVKIAVSAAKGLEFLHDKAKPPVIHTNITSSNILLFDNDVAKIGDVGVSIEMPIETDYYYYYYDDGEAPPPLSGYEAPECMVHEIEEYNKKTDIYSFGVVLLELLSSRRAASLRNNPLIRQETLVSCVDRIINKEGKLNKRCLIEFVDKRLTGQSSCKAAAKMFIVAANCLRRNPEYRPGMSIVVEKLSQLLDSIGGTQGV